VLQYIINVYCVSGNHRYSIHYFAWVWCSCSQAHARVLSDMRGVFPRHNVLFNRPRVVCDPCVCGLAACAGLSCCLTTLHLFAFFAASIRVAVVLVDKLRPSLEAKGLPVEDTSADIIRLLSTQLIDVGLPRLATFMRAVVADSLRHSGSGLADAITPDYIDDTFYELIRVSMRVCGYLQSSSVGVCAFVWWGSVFVLIRACTCRDWRPHRPVEHASHLAPAALMRNRMSQPATLVTVAPSRRCFQTLPAVLDRTPCRGMHLLPVL
jgi:hypothetical protein